MKQGKFGLCLAFYGVLSFVLALLDQPLLCGLLLAFVLVAEGDRHTVRQVLQGFMLSLVVSFCLSISYMVGSFVSVPFRILLRWPNYEFNNTVQTVFSVLIYAGALILSIMAILRLIRGQEANIPVLSNLAYTIMGEKKPRPVKQQPLYPQGNYPQPPMQYPPQQGAMPPMQGQPGVPPQPYPVPPQGPQPPQAPAPMAQPAAPAEPPAPAPQQPQPATPEQQPPQQL